MKIFKHIISVILCVSLLFLAWKGYTLNSTKHTLIKIQDRLHYLSEAAIKEEVAMIMRNFPNNPDMLLAMETKLRNYDWIKEVAVFRDLKNNICINIEEYQADLKIFTTNYSSFFVAVDDTLHIIKGQYERPPRTFVCLGFPSYKVDSAAIKFLVTLSKEIAANEVVAKNFSHFNYINSSSIEIINTHDSPKIIVSKDNKPSTVINRLEQIYENVIAKKGWNYYKTLNFKFSLV